MMALRIFLVVVVASLGFEWPGGDVFSSWSQAGRGWVEARRVDLSVLSAEVERAIAGESEARPPEKLADYVVPTHRSDLVFEAVNESMAHEMAADLSSLQAEASRRLAQPSVRGESIEPEPECFEVVGGSGPDVRLDDSAAPTELPPSESRPGRISSAISLTRQAVQAWASLAQPPTDEPEAAR